MDGLHGGAPRCCGFGRSGLGPRRLGCAAARQGRPEAARKGRLDGRRPGRARMPPVASAGFPVLRWSPGSARAKSDWTNAPSRSWPLPPVHSARSSRTARSRCGHGSRSSPAAVLTRHRNSRPECWRAWRWAGAWKAQGLVPVPWVGERFAGWVPSRASRPNARCGRERVGRAVNAGDRSRGRQDCRRPAGSCRAGRRRFAASGVQSVFSSMWHCGPTGSDALAAEPRIGSRPDNGDDRGWTRLGGRRTRTRTVAGSRQRSVGSPWSRSCGGSGTA